MGTLYNICTHATRGYILPICNLWLQLHVPSCGMSTNIVQSAHRKCLELHNVVPIFFKKNSGGGPPDPSPFHLYFLRVCFKKFL